MTPAASPPSLDDRKSAILRALVEEYTRTGHPVSSRAIGEVTRLGVSSATIRNDLAVLERDGLVAQPHTSAGRIPTDLGYRYYIDHLSPTPLRSSIINRIAGFFASAHRELEKTLQQTSDLLADITHYPAVVLGPGLTNDTVHGVHLMQVGSDAVMLVLVADSGRIVKDIAKLPGAASATHVAAAERALADALCGQPVAGVAEKVHALSGRRSEDVSQVVQAAAEAAQRSLQQSHHLYLGGTGQVTELWAEMDKLQRILEFLEREAIVLNLLAQTAERTSVRIGSELPVPADTDLAVVSRSVEMGLYGTGRLGVFGPKRMDYGRTIKVVEEVGEGLGDSLGN